VYTRLFILIEGPDDEKFFDRVIKPILIKKYDDVIPYKYAERPKKKIVQLIKSVVRIEGADFICLADINNSPSIAASKQKIQNGKIGNVDKDKIVIVIKEIESWYIAGLDDICCRELGIPSCDTTDDINKERFNALVSRSKDKLRMSCMSEMLKTFNVLVAKQKNESFNYFYREYLQ